MPQVSVGEATEEVWYGVLPRDVTDRELSQAVIWYLRDAKKREWPTPAHVLAYVKKYRNWQQNNTVSEAECRECGGLGLVLSHDYRGRGVQCMQTCRCPFGRSKAVFLEDERKAGRAWTGEERV